VYTRDHLAASIRHEVRIIRHLAGKVPAGTLDWRPTPGQRSTRELLRYLSVATLPPAAFVRTGSWEGAERFEEEAGGLDVEKDFDAAMVRQEEELLRILGSFSDEELLGRGTAMPWGAPCMTGQGLVDMCLKCLVAYRMQLFLYAKMSGNADLGPANCWVGVDAPKG
jgi:hypothetical protein